MQPKPRILVAEDEPAIGLLVSLRLLMAGYEVETARNGHEALRHITGGRFDGVVLDINMPELDGFGVLTAMAELPPSHSPPVLILSARHGSEDVQQAITLGAKDYLKKPFTEALLMSRVARLLRPALPASPAEASGRGDQTLI